MSCYCIEDTLFCKAFAQAYPMGSLRGFNAQITNNLSWDTTSAPLLSLNSVLPATANNVTNLSTSTNYQLSVNWSIQGALNTAPPYVGVTGGGGVSESWGWSKADSINIPDWAIDSKGLPPLPTSVVDFYAFKGPNNAANLMAYANLPGQGVLSSSTGDLTDLQKNFLTERTESDWTTKFSNQLLPSGKSTLTVNLNARYGEVYDAYTALDQTGVGIFPYSALHNFPVTIPLEFDFSKAILRPPLDADWTVQVILNRNVMQGFFPVQGTVTLNQSADIDTVVNLGAQVYPSGGFTPAPSVIKNLASQLVIPAGQLSAAFNAMAQQVGSAYNLRWYVFQNQGKQAIYEMTVPAS